MDIMSIINSNGPFLQTIILIVAAGIAIVQLIILNKQIKGNSLQQIQLNDRDIKKLRFNHPWLTDDPETLSEHQKRQVKFYYNLLINHAKHIYMQHDLGTIPDVYWEAVDRDLRHSIANPEFKSAWKLMRNYVPDNFRTHVDSIIN